MRAARAAIALLVLAMSAGCTAAAPQDKLGSDAVVIRLATIDDVNNNGQSFGPQAFVEALSKVSGGQLRASVDRVTFTGGEADAESRLVRALASGEVDAGWPSVRAFAGADIPGFELVEAPLTLTSYDAQRELVTSPLADSLLDRLEGTGVHGLAMTVGPLRRPFALGSALLEPADWAGQRIRSYNSQVQSATITALGAEPVSVGSAWVELARTGQLRGVEFDIAQYVANGFTTEAGEIPRNVVLWPKVFVLAASQRLLDRLDEQQRQWVLEAADQARRASVEATYDEDELATDLCDQGVEFPAATAEQIEELRAAVRPVVDDLAADPLWPELVAIAQRHPEPDQLDAPDTCLRRVTVVAGDPGPAPETLTTLPNGRYRVQITLADLNASAITPSRRVGQAGTYTLTVADDSYVIDCTPISGPGGLDCWYAQRLPPSFDSNPRSVGRITGDDSTIYLAHDTELERLQSDCVVDPARVGPDVCAGSIRLRVAWQLDGDELRFGDQVSTEPWWAMGIKPWIRIE